MLLTAVYNDIKTVLHAATVLRTINQINPEDIRQKIRFQVKIIFC